MKTGFITTMLLLFAAGMAQAQDNQTKIDGNPNVNTIVVNTTGDVTIYQGDKFAVKWNDETVHYNMNFELKDSVAYLSGTDDFEVTMPMLKYLEVNSAGDVVARDEIVAKNISICSNGSGDVDLNLICSNIYLRNNGSGEVTLRGNANALMIETFGSGDFNAVNLKHSVSFVNAIGSGEGDLGKVRKMVFVHNSNHYAGQILDNCPIATSLGSPIRFEQDHSNWRIKGYEHLAINDDAAAVMNAAAPFFNQEQNHNRGIAESEDLTNVTENDTLKNTREQLDEDLGNLVKDITQGIIKGSRENWDEDQWNAWGDSLEMRAKEYERGMRKYEKEVERDAKNSRSSTNVNVQYNRHEREHKTLLYDAQWGGFEAGLNILTPGVNHWNAELPSILELRQMRSWCFNINIADVGIAFNRQHSMGIFTGIGIGWNNYSFNKKMFFQKDANGFLNTTPILDEQGLPLNIDRSKIGVFYAQMPLMLEFKPFRQRMYIDLGVTFGMRITSWQTVQFGPNRGKYAILGEGEDAEIIAADRAKELQHKDLCVNFFKADATLRIGSADDNLGLFVKYALLPLFTEGKVKDVDGNVIQNVYPLNIGFSINF